MSDLQSGSPTNDKKSTDLYTRMSDLLAVDKDRDWSTVSRRVATRLLAGGGAALALVATGMTGFRSAYANKIYPNIAIGDVQVGGMTVKEAETAVQKRVDELNSSGLHFHYEGNNWEPTLEEIGATVDVPAVVARAAELGRDEKAADRLMFTNQLMQDTQIVPLQWSLKPWLLEAWLDKVDSDIGKPAVDATFTVKGADLEITDDATGVVADRKSTTSAILDSLKNFEKIEAELPTETDFPRITKADLEANESEVLNVLGNSVTVRFEDQRWDIQPDQVSAYMMFSSDMVDGRPETHVDFDRTELARYLREAYEGQVNRVPVNSKVQYFQGQLSTTTASQDGTALLANQFADLVAESFLGNHERVDVPVVITRPKVREDNLDTMGIKEPLCRVTSNFMKDVGTDREINIVVGARLLNNAIVAPGDKFSFNRTVGSIEANPDFVGGTGISGGVITEEFGGGICQCTTTVFRAAVMAGLPIDNWDPHTYRLTVYEADGWGPGYDASIFQPEWQAPEDWSDLVFTNNTGNYILVSSWTDNGYHVVEIYGTNPGWKIDISETSIWEVGPSDNAAWYVDWNAGAGTNYISAYPVVGLGASFNRTVYDAEGNEMYTRDFTSNYQSRGYQCRCSPDMEGIPCW